MPWEINEHGERVYKPSLYTKDELPTWNEAYNEFYLHDVSAYDPSCEDHCANDLYWKIPRRKVLIALMANQFNKMLYEDGYHERMIAFLNQDRVENIDKALDIRFVIEPLPDIGEVVRKVTNQQEWDVKYDKHLVRWNAFLQQKSVGKNAAPPIYTIPHPKGNPNPFITNDHPRIDITTLDGRLHLYPIIHTVGEHFIHIEAYYPQDWYQEYEDIRKGIIRFMMDGIIQYFEGEGVGWKDADGHLIDRGSIPSSCQGSGADPAL